jgi:8-oxo-dGTP pyrophosphatase MutT (NUDIX family)
VAAHTRSHAFVVRDGEILVLQQASGGNANWWGQPGGDVEDGERPAITVIRETFEETGLRIEAPELLRTWSYRDRRGDRVQCFMHVAEAPAGDVVLSDEHTDYAWLTIDEYERAYCNAPAAAPEWVKEFLAEMRENCAAFREWQGRNAGLALS